MSRREKSLLNQEAMELLRNLGRMKQTQQSWSTGKACFKNPPHSQPSPSHYQSLAQYPWELGLLHWFGSFWAKITFSWQHTLKAVNIHKGIYPPNNLWSQNMGQKAGTKKCTGPFKTRMTSFLIRTFFCPSIKNFPGFKKCIFVKGVKSSKELTVFLMWSNYFLLPSRR